MDGESITYDSKRQGSPEVRFIHYNDVYHIEEGSREPVGGIARFQSLCNYYRSDPTFKDQSSPFTLFSGDAFNPSLESSVTKGSHMVPVLNDIGTDCACVGNHDLDFGVPKFQELANQCKFPWLLANVLDPGLGPDVPLGNAQKTLMLTSSNGVKIGIMGLVEREWLDAVKTLPPNLQYKSASATAQELATQLRAQGAEMIIALTHQREPNDNKLAQKTIPGTIDLILGGHDHFYGHSIINNVHILRSGTDFKQLSYIQAWRLPSNSEGDKSNWDFTITRREVVRSLPANPEAAALVDKLSAKLKSRLEKPIGYTASPLDARFTTVRLKESNYGNFVCDIMRLYYSCDCAVMIAGTIRGDQIYPPGLLRLKDITNCFPFEDPVVVVRVTGVALKEALENSVSTYPAQEGRFPQVSNIEMSFNAQAPPMKRVTSVKVGGKVLVLDKKYVLATRDYMARGKDGFNTLLYDTAGGQAETVVSEENGMLISMLLRQYFTSMRIVDKIKGSMTGGETKEENGANHMDDHWVKVHEELHESHPVRYPAINSPAPKGRMGDGKMDHETVEDDLRDEDEAPQETANDVKDNQLYLVRRVLKRWRRLVGIHRQPECAHDEEEEIGVGWTKGVAPRVEGRITIINEYQG